MTDEDNTPHTTSGLPAPLRKILFAVGVLAVAMVVMPLLPRLLLGDYKPNAVVATPTAPPAPPMPVVAAPPPPPAPQPQYDEAIADLAARLDTIETRLSDIQAAQATSKAQAEATQQRSTEQRATLTELSQLKGALLQGRGFLPYVEHLETLAGGREDIAKLLAQLKPYAENGVGTAETLRTSLQAAIDNYSHRAGQGFVHSTMRSLITVRKVGEPEGSDDDAIIARAETKVKNSDIEGAIKELTKVSTPEPFVPWLKSADNYLSAHATLKALETTLAQDTHD